MAVTLWLLTLFWTIWRETNQRAFENVETMEQSLKAHFMHSFLECVSHHREGSSLSKMDVIDWLGA